MAARDRRLAVAAVLLAGVAGVAFARAVLRAQAPETGPAPVAWDREACTRCRMLISERRFAAQARDVDGRVHHFDDPGCLLLWRDEHDGQLAEIYFHHVDDERWVAGDRAVFVPADATPMAYGLAVRDAGEGLALEEAHDRVRTLEASRGSNRSAPVRESGETPDVP